MPESAQRTLLCYLHSVSDPKAPKNAKAGGFIIPGSRAPKPASPDPAKDDRRQVNNPLHGLTLEVIVTRLVDHYGFEELGELIPINCFRINASIRSSLKYLRLTPRARARVEDLYLATFPS